MRIRLTRKAASCLQDAIEAIDVDPFTEPDNNHPLFKILNMAEDFDLVVDGGPSEYWEVVS